MSTYLFGDIVISDTDDCVGHGCANGATCIDHLGGYTCDCADGYVGTLCDTGGYSCGYCAVQLDY